MANLFGIEIRKANNIQHLYRDIDRALCNINMQKMQQSAIAHALQNMLQQKGHFSICTIRECASRTNENI